MRADPGTSDSSRSLKVAAVVAILMGLQVLVLLGMLRSINLSLPFHWQALAYLRSLLPAVLGGYLLHLVAHALRGKGRSYAQTVARPRHWGLTLLLVTTLTGLMIFYADLKLVVPLLSEGVRDGILWEIDAALLFGLSPNVFVLNLLDQSQLLRFIDFGYGYFFFFAVVISYPLVLPLRDDRLRTSFVAANAVLWSLGAWLYLLVPSLGPAYSFHEVWDPFRSQFPVSTYWQKQLLDNYQMVLEMGRGRIDPRLSLFEGIGAFPSLHVGFQTLFALYLGRLSRLAGRVAWLLVLLTFMGSVLTGWHYLVDSLAGLGMAYGSFWLFERVILPERPARDGSEEASP